MKRSENSENTSPAERIVRCPQCGGDSRWSPENPYRPFCSQRCKLIDLGAWASESYRIPAQAPADEPDAGNAGDGGNGISPAGGSPAA